MKEIIAYLISSIFFKPFIKFRKNIFLFVLCFSHYLFFEVLATEENQEPIDKIRTFLHKEATFKRGQQTIVAEKFNDVASSTFSKFINNKPTSQKSTNKIIEKFKKEYATKYEEFKLPFVSSPIKSVDSILPSQTASIQSYPRLDLCTLPFHISHPDTYSLLMADSSLIKNLPSTGWDQHPAFKDLGSRFLRPSLAKDKNVSFSSTEQEVQEKTLWILKDEKTSSEPNEKAEPYYIIQSFKKRETLGSLNLIKSITKQVTNPLEGFDFQAALIIFPFLQEKAMIYGLGRWDSLLNPECIIPQWGLRIVTSGQICNPNQIKEFHADHYRVSNPFSKREKVAVPQPIEVFGLEVGSEELKMISLMPNKSVRTQHVIEGGDHLSFTVNPSDKATSEQTLQSLHIIAKYFFNLATDANFHVHSRMREFIDDELKEPKMVLALKQYLQNLLRVPEGKETLFLHNILWKDMKNKKLRFGESKKQSVFDIFTSLDPEVPFPETIQVWKPRSKQLE